MKLLFKTANHRRPRKETWFVSRAALVAASMLFAAFAVYYWAFPIYEQGEKVLAAFIAALFLSSAAVTPAVAPKLVHAKSGSFLGLAVVCVAFGLIDTVGTSGGLIGLDKDMSEKEYQAEMIVFQAEKSSLGAELQAYKDEIKAVRDKFGVSGEIRNASSLSLLTDDLTKERDRVQANLDSLGVPSRTSRFNVEFALFISSLIQLALAVGMISLESTRTRKHVSEVEAYETRLAKSRAQRKRKQAIASKAQTSGANVVHF